MGSASMRGWRRLGIVLSVFWFVGFGWWLRQDDFNRAGRDAGYEMCSTRYDVKRDAPEFSVDQIEPLLREYYDCVDQAGARFVRLASPWWAIIVSDALSVGALWLLAWIALVVGRWQQA